MSIRSSNEHTTILKPHVVALAALMLAAIALVALGPGGAVPTIWLVFGFLAGHALSGSI